MNSKKPLSSVYLFTKEGRDDMFDRVQIGKIYNYYWGTGSLPKVFVLAKQKENYTLTILFMQKLVSMSLFEYEPTFCFSVLEEIHEETQLS